jgi:polyhydroxyalkanoate synthesis repressor PhaR
LKRCYLHLLQLGITVMAEVRLIRKCANRRFYDPRESRHVTLRGIREIVAAGEHVKVVKEKGGEDITRAILLQIIAGEEQFGKPVLSTQFLEAIIRFYGNPIQEMLASQLERYVGSLLGQHEGPQAEMDKILENPMESLGEVARKNMQLWTEMQASVLSALAPRGDPASPEKDAKPNKRRR